MNKKFYSIGLTLIASGWVFGGEIIDISLEEVPVEIMAAAKKVAPLAEFSRANIEVEEDGSRVYELSGLEKEHKFAVAPTSPEEIDISAFDDDGFGLQLREVVLSDIQIEVDILQGGAFEEVERIIPERLVPGMVLKRVRQEYPGFVSNRIEASYNDHAKIFRYEFEGMLNGKPLDLEVSADGSKIVEADE